VRRSRRPISPQRASRGWRGSGLMNLPSAPVAAGPQVADQPLLLDSRGVGALIGLGRTKVFQMMASGELPVVRIGRCVRVPRSGLESWIASRTEISEMREDRQPVVRWGAANR
jgi:excisionase family DNA binding protein